MKAIQPQAARRAPRTQTAFVFFVVALLAVPPANAQLNIFPDQVDANVRMEITKVRPGRWPWLPWRREAMRRQGWTPHERRGRTRIVDIRTKVTFASPKTTDKK